MATLRCGSRLYGNIEAVLFDKDGTLADSAPYLIQLGQYRAQALEAQAPGVEGSLLRAFGLQDGQLNPAGLLAVASRAQTQTAAAALVAAMGYDWHGAIAIAQPAFEAADTQMPRKAESTTLFPEARPLLAQLTQAQVKVGVISADVTANIDDFLAHHGLTEQVALVWGNDCHPAKPDPLAYVAVCEMLGVAPAQTLMLGDAAGDLSMATGAGAAGAIGVLWGWEGLGAIAGADLLLHHWHELEVVET